MSGSALEMAWSRLAAHRATLEAVHMRDLFAADSGRFQRFSLRLGDLLLDYSKHRITAETMALLVDLASAAGVEARRDAMFAGERINVTEDRAALHVALRNRSGRPIFVDGQDAMPEIEATLRRVGAFAEAVRSGAIAGARGDRFTDVVNIGIGGSDLGPAMAVAALRSYCEGVNAHFVSNVHSAHLRDTLAGLAPERTLFIVASKTFTTLETMTNARSARDWLVGALGEGAVPAHFAAVSSNPSRTAGFGIPGDRVFGFRDWVGGRYSVWSAIGLPLAIAIGFGRFQEFLAGGHEMDEHFRTAPLGRNMPAIMALLGLWYRDVWGCATHGLMPYDQRLARFPAHIQQLDMESNGKRVRLDGSPVDRPTAPVIWGEPGTNGQHAFFQLLHQGTEVVPCDFLLAAEPDVDMGPHQAILASNCFGQSEALMRGRTEAEARRAMEAEGLAPAEIDRLAPHRVFPGNRPSSTLLYRRLDPATLGRLVALYEHKVFVQGAVWGIDSFDQWGVELGKERASALLPAIGGSTPPMDTDCSTAGLLAAYRALRRE